MAIQENPRAGAGQTRHFATYHELKSRAEVILQAPKGNIRRYESHPQSGPLPITRTLLQIDLTGAPLSSKSSPTLLKLDNDVRCSNGYRGPNVPANFEPNCGGSVSLFRETAPELSKKGVCIFCKTRCL